MCVLLAFRADAAEYDVMVIHLVAGYSCNFLIHVRNVIEVFYVHKSTAFGAFDVVMSCQNMIKTICTTRNGNLIQQSAFNKAVQVAVNSTLADIRVLQSDTVIYFFSSRVIR